MSEPCVKCGSALVNRDMPEKDIRQLLCPNGCHQDKCPKCHGRLTGWNDGMMSASQCLDCGFVLSVKGERCAESIRNSFFKGMDNMTSREDKLLRAQHRVDLIQTVCAIYRNYSTSDNLTRALNLETKEALAELDALGGLEDVEDTERKG